MLIFTIHKQLCRLLGVACSIRGNALELAVVTSADALNAQCTDSGRHFGNGYLILIVGNLSPIQQPLE